MEFRPLRTVSVPQAAEREYTRWVGELGDRLSDDGVDRNELTRRVLTGIYYPQYTATAPDDPELPAAARLALLQLDPRNVTLEAEYYPEIDPERYRRVKPVQWLWELFDRSPLGANVALAVPLRRTLARHVFRSVGRNFKAFQDVRFTFGYNLEVGDDVVIHRGTTLDDRGGIRVGDGVAIAEFATVHSQRRSLGDDRFVETPVTVLGEGVRIGHHASVLAGVRLEEGAVLGAMAVATTDIEAGAVALGIPARRTLDRPAPEKRPHAPRTTDPLADPVPPPAPIPRPNGADPGT